MFTLWCQTPGDSLFIPEPQSLRANINSRHNMRVVCVSVCEMQIIKEVLYHSSHV